MVVIAMSQPATKKKQRTQCKRRPQRISVFNINDDAINPKLVREIFSQYGRVGKVEIYSRSGADTLNPYSPSVQFELHDGKLEEETIIWNGKELWLETR